MGYKVILEQLLPIIAHMLEEEKPEVGCCLIPCICSCSSCQGCLLSDLMMIITRIDQSFYAHSCDMQPALLWWRWHS